MMSNEDLSPSGENQSNSTSPHTAMSRSVDREMVSEVQPENVTEDHVMIDADDENPAVNGEKASDSTESDEGPKEITPASPFRPKIPLQNGYSSPTAARSEVSVVETPMSIKDSKNLAELNEHVKSSSPEVLQALLKENWRPFLFETSSGSQTTQNITHLSFILRAGFKNSPTVVLDKVLNSAAFFRPEAVDIIARKNVIADKVLSDSTSSQLLRQVPEKVLEQAFMDHLKVMPAKQIITMLAKADRLGYKHDDILDPEDESVMPYMPTPGQEDEDMTDEAPAHFSNHGLALPDTDPLLAEQERNAAALRMMPPVTKGPKPPKLPKQLKGASFKEVPPRPTGPMECAVCHRMLPNYSAYNFHAKKRVCEKVAPTEGWKWQCGTCGLGFSGKAGLVYHENKKVCQSDDIAHATTPSRQLQDEAAAVQSMVNLQDRPRDLHPQTYVPPPQPIARVQIPVQTPHRSSPISKAQDSEPRQQLSPSQLPADKLEQMNKQLADQDTRYNAQKAAVATDDRFPSQEDKRTRLASLKASDATRRSQIRKSFGVTLRMRDKDKQKLANTNLQNVRPSLEGFRRTSGPGTPAHSSSPLVGNFSPINAPPNGPRNSYQPPVPPNFGVLVPGSSKYTGSRESPNMHNSPHFPNAQPPQIYSQPPPTSSSMAPIHYGQFTPPLPQHPNHQHPHKRQRTSGEGTYSPNPGPNGVYTSPYSSLQTYQPPSSSSKEYISPYQTTNTYNSPVSHTHPHQQHPNQLPPLQNYPPSQYSNQQYNDRQYQAPQNQQGMSMVELRSEDAATRISKDKEKRKSSTSWLKPSFESPSGAGASQTGGVSQQTSGPSQATINNKIQNAVIVLSSSESDSEGELRDKAGLSNSSASTANPKSGSGLRVELTSSRAGEVDADKPLPSVEVVEDEVVDAGVQSPKSVRSPGGGRGGFMGRRGAKV